MLYNVFSEGVAMRKLSVNQAKKMLIEIKKMKRRNLTCDDLSKSIGIFPEVIADNLSYFDPLITMDFTYNIMDLVPQIEEYIRDSQVKKEKKPAKPLPKIKKEADKYVSIQDYVYQNMTIAGGIVDKSKELSIDNLKVMKRLIEDEIKKRKGKK